MIKILRSRPLCLAMLTILLLLLNVLVINTAEIEISRIMRVVSIITLLIFFIYHKGFMQSTIFIVLIIFSIRDILLIQYETAGFKTFTFFLTILAYVSIISLNIRKIRISRSTPVIFIFVLSLVGLNIFNVYYLSDVIEAGLDNNIQYFLFFVQGAVLILLGFVAFLFNERYLGKIPLLYLYAAFSFVLTDLTGLVAYYFKIDVAYFPERCFYILALSLLICHTLKLNDVKDGKIYEIQKDFII